MNFSFTRLCPRGLNSVSNYHTHQQRINNGTKDTNVEPKKANTLNNIELEA